MGFWSIEIEGFEILLNNVKANSECCSLQFTGSGLNNFYSRFCNDTTHNKPMVITETSAMYNPSNPQGSTNFAIKQNWWQQVFNVQGNSALVRTCCSYACHQNN